jgi:hypothetical protein
MKPWIVLNGILLILVAIHNLILLANVNAFAIGNVLWLLFAYFFLVVLLFKKEIENEAGTDKVQYDPDNLMMIIQ